MLEALAVDLAHGYLYRRPEPIAARTIDDDHDGRRGDSRMKRPGPFVGEIVARARQYLGTTPNVRDLPMEMAELKVHCQAAVDYAEGRGADMTVEEFAAHLEAIIRFSSEGVTEVLQGVGNVFDDAKHQ